MQKAKYLTKYYSNSLAINNNNKKKKTINILSLPAEALLSEETQLIIPVNDRW